MTALPPHGAGHEQRADTTAQCPMHRWLDVRIKDLTATDVGCLIELRDHEEHPDQPIDLTGTLVSVRRRWWWPATEIRLLPVGGGDVICVHPIGGQAVSVWR